MVNQVLDQVDYAPLGSFQVAHHFVGLLQLLIELPALQLLQLVVRVHDLKLHLDFSMLSRVLE